MRELKIELSLTLPEIMDVIESLPATHSLLPLLQRKADTLLAARRIQAQQASTNKSTAHKPWCPLRRHPDLSIIPGQNWCNCLLNRKD